jgi:hypothetical protein
LLLTFFFGVEFLGIKAFEYACQYQSKQIWGAGFYEKPEWLTGVVISTPVASVGTASVASARASATVLDPQIPASSMPAAARAPLGLTTVVKNPATLQSAASSRVHHSIDPARPVGAHMFYALYYMTTGLHAIHLLFGLGVLLWLTRRTARREFGPKYSTPVELGGLYWNLLTVVSMLVFVLYYLA